VQGPEYVGYASYYHGLVAYLLTTLTVAFASRTPRLGQRAVAAFFVVLTVHSAIGLPRRVEPDRQLERSGVPRARRHPSDARRAIRCMLRRAPARCRRGIGFPPGVPFASLGARPCSIHGGAPEVLELTAGELRLVPRRDSHGLRTARRIRRI
jgi:hypothetical protein